MNKTEDDIRSRIVNSMALQEKAKKLIPGMTQLLSKRPDRFSYGVWPGYFSKAKGAKVWDLDGNEYLDMSIGGIGANVLGYCDPDVDEAVVDAVRKGTSSSLNCPEEVNLAELLCEIHPWADMVRYAKTGGEAMAIAVRIARAHTGKDKVAFCGYHGWHDWYLAANLGDNDYLQDHLQAGLIPKGVPSSLAGSAYPFNYNDLDELKRIVEKHGNDLAAIVMEPIRNIEPEPGFLEGVMELAKENGIILVIDEISAAFRLNSGGAHLLYDLIPDIAVFSKSIGNGYPIAAVIGNSEVMQAAQKTFISSTYWTERIGLVAALATIKKHVNEKAAKHLKYVGQSIQNLLKETSDKHDIKLSVQGIPPLTHFAFKYAEDLKIKAFFIQEMLKKGILATNSFYSMYAHNDEDLNNYNLALNEIFSSLHDIITKDDIDNYLLGEPSVKGFKRMN